MCAGTLENKVRMDREGTTSERYRVHRRGGGGRPLLTTGEPDVEVKLD
jgi:hypothetical protein